MEQEINRLNKLKEICKNSYSESLIFFQNRLERLEAQIERTTENSLKREILDSQKVHIINEIANLDTAVEDAVRDIDDKIQVIKNEEGSFEHTMKKLKAYLKRRNVNEIFDAFEMISNALIILRREHTPVDS